MTALRAIETGCHTAFPAPAPRRSTVAADDGVPLAVTEYGSPSAPLTIVFVHGHCLRSESFDYLREHLGTTFGTDTRMVFYDHRGHGNSGSGPVHSYTIDQLGHDLDVVLRTVVPTGPVVLVGHSMGAMTAMVYARQHPEQIGSRIVGIGLLATAASGITEAGFGKFLRRPTVAVLNAAVRWAPGVLHASKRMGRTICAPIVRNAGFGNRRVSPAMVAFATAMLNETSVVTMSSFLASFRSFDESATLASLSCIPTLVIGGSADFMTPFQHSVAIAQRVSGAELVCLDGAGHSLILERAAEVARSIAALVSRVSNELASSYELAAAS
ncbi:alpha/beta hydrolase [Skermania sp. ID1734]|uniref:alpha/beta fold hydrolase n=1 Tax=Skermania sp. ID1734 TaxID=2597516 RepID=UPI00117E7F04|nr:alpha/beta hydrolase [Skermania sp. ID1734]TSE00367.1 alpha/beta hydrolase [Skermania sp. ID1734]